MFKNLFVEYKGTPGECYRSAFEFIQVNPDWHIVHGIPRLATTGEAYGHAWCEIDHPFFGRLCIDPSAPKGLHTHVMPAAMFYHAGRISYAVHYTYEEAVENMVRTELYGPWDETVNEALHA